MPDESPVAFAPLHGGPTALPAAAVPLAGPDFPADRGDPYAVLAAALPAAHCDPAAARAAALAFAALELNGPARELLARLGDDGPSRALAQRLAGRPSGRESWSRHQARFEAHTRRLYAVHPSLVRFDADFRDVPRRLELFRARDNVWRVAWSPARGERRWIGGFVDAGAAVRDMTLPHDPAALFCAPYVVVGDYGGELLDRVHQATRKMFLTFTPHIFVIEPEPVVFGAALYVRESVDALADPRVVPLLGPDWRAALDEFLAAHPRVRVPEHVVAPPGAPRDLIDAVLARLREASRDRQRRAIDLIGRAQARYDALAPDHWRRRFADPSGEPLRVLGVTSRYTTVLQHAMRDLGRAFEQQGCAFELLIEATDHELIGRDAIAAAVELLRPDLVFIIDHHRHEYGGAIPANVPFVCWIQDLLPHLMSAAAGRSLGALDFYIAPELDQLTRAYAYPSRQGLASPMTTSEHTYSADPLPADELEPLRCDFSFVSNQAVTPDAFRHDWLARFRAGPDAARVTEYLLGALRDEFAADPRTAFARPVDALLERAARATGVAPASPQQADHLARSFIHPAGELIFRHHTLEWVADYCESRGRSLHLYGNGWDAHPRFARYARGVVRNGRCLRAVYQASLVNLQIIGSGAIHQRLLDGLMSGGFFLCRYTPIDHIAPVVRRLLAALDASRPPDGAGDATQAATADPAVTAALHALDALHGAPPRNPARLAAWELNRYREHAAQGFARVAADVLPLFEQVTFGSASEFAERADSYLGRPDERRRIAAAQREAVRARYTCGVLVRRLLSLIAARL